MAAYVYKARDPGGQLQQGKAEAGSEAELISRLRNQGFLVLTVERDRDLQSLVQTRGGILFARKPSGKDLAVFARQFATMINAGLPVVTALKVLTRQTTNVRLQRALAVIAADVEAGETLTAAFSRHPDVFPTVMLQMIAAGEVGGILDEVLTRVADQLEKEENIRQKVRSAMVYPIIVSCVAVIVVIFLMLFVVPSFIEVYADFEAELPLPTKMLIGICGFMQRFWWLLGSIAVVGLVVGRWWLKTEAGATFWDRFVLKVPIFGPMVAKQAIARFSRTLGSLVASGITIIRALTVVEKTVGNRIVAAAVHQAAEAVQQGQTLVEPLRQSGVFPPMVIEMISVGEETGTMEEMLKKVADFYEAEVERTAERLSAMIEPLIIMGLAGCVGMIVVSMMLPIFNLWGTIE